MKEIPYTAIEVQEGLYFNKLAKKGCELFAKDGYHFYDIQNTNNYDEDGNLRLEEDIYCTYMTCLCETAEQVNGHIVSVKK
jgi:hypothetical protein